MQAKIRADGDAVVVTGAPDLYSDRSIRLFFSSVLGASPIDGGWLCHRRSRALSSLIIIINNFLESHHFSVERAGEVDDTVQREIERRRSFRRSRELAILLRSGQQSVDIAAVKKMLVAFGWDETQRKLFPHQEIGVIHGLTAVNAANFSVPGAGKTVTALAVAATHVANRNIDIILVVGPLSCFGPWETECRAALGSRLRPSRVRGNARYRRARYVAADRGEILLMSYATAAADKASLIGLCRRHRVMLIVDESHRVKRFRGGVWAPALMDIAKYARVKMTLSGTPMPQTGKDLYSQLRILWPSGDLTGTPDEFATRVDQSFDSVLADVRPFVSRTPKQALDLDPYRIRFHVAELVGTQAEIYDLIEGQFRKILQDAKTWTGKIDVLRRARPIRLLQAACNPDVLNNVDGYFRLPRLTIPNPSLMQRLAAYKAIEVPAKSLRAIQIIEDIVRRRSETGGKTVCWSNFILNLDQFAELVRVRLGLPVFQIDGRVPTGDTSSDDAPVSNGEPTREYDTREQIIENFLRTDGPAVLVTNPASTSESISLHSTCHNAIYLDRTYDCALFLQSIDRIHRLGLRKGQVVDIHIITAEQSGHRLTIDGLVEASLVAKETTMRRLLEGADLAPLTNPDTALESAEGDLSDLDHLLKYLLGEDIAR